MNSVQPNRAQHPVLMADQWGASSLGCYGCAVPGVTPHLDELARGGLRFNRHYANAPVCGPSRASIFSGRSPAAHGVFHNNIEASRDTPFFTHALRETGYKTLGVGKFHFSPMQLFPPDNLREFGFDEVWITEDPKHGAYLDWVRDQHPEHFEAAFALSWPMPYLDAYPPDGENLRPAWKQAWQKHVAPQQQPPFRSIFHPSPLPAALHQSTWIADRAIQKLGECAQDDAPFFLFASFVDPHDPYDPPAPYSEMFEPNETPIPLPQNWTLDNGPRDYAAFHDTMFGISDFDQSDWQRLRALFFGSCHFVDDQIGRILGELKRLGLDENTLVVFTTDHGEILGDHGLLMKGPWHFDATVRCPLIVSGPGVAHGKTVEKLSCTLDFAPSFLDWAGAEKTDLEGQVLPLSSTELKGFTGHEEVVIETNASYVNERGGCRTLVTDDGWRLTLFPGEPYGELFDLRRDPLEANNLFDSPRHSARKTAMMERLIGAMARQIYPFPRGQWAKF